MLYNLKSVFYDEMPALHNETRVLYNEIYYAMKQRPNTEDYKHIFLNDIPLMDVRAPVEFDKGAFPNSQNIFLLDNLQREQIGTIYKNNGKNAAFDLATLMATKEIKAHQLKKWLQFCQNNPNGYLYCFRGGYRSKTTKQWLSEQNTFFPLVNGGYKAMRQFLLHDFETNIEHVPMALVGGSTGTGKTRVLKNISNKIDFEGLACHRGSAFGRNFLDYQPSQISWENSVYIKLLKHRENILDKTLFVEDEGRQIGRICLPELLRKKMKTLPIVVLEEPLEYRLGLIIEDYILSVWPNYQKQYGDNANQKFSDYVLDSLFRIKKRLGGQRYQSVKESFTKALSNFFNNNTIDGFEEGVIILLTEYYDPMYEYQLKQKESRIIFRGGAKDLIDFANNR